MSEYDAIADAFPRGAGVGTPGPREQERAMSESNVRVDISVETPLRDGEHLWLRDLRRHPLGEVRLYSRDGRLISGTAPYQVTASIDEMLRVATAPRT